MIGMRQFDSDDWFAARLTYARSQSDVRHSSTMRVAQSEYDWIPGQSPVDVKAFVEGRRPSAPVHASVVSAIAQDNLDVIRALGGLILQLARCSHEGESCKCRADGFVAVDRLREYVASAERQLGVSE